MPPAVFGGLLSARLDLSARQPAGKALLASAAAVCTYYLSWLLSLVSFFCSIGRSSNTAVVGDQPLPRASSFATSAAASALVDFCAFERLTQVFFLSEKQNTERKHNGTSPSTPPSPGSRPSTLPKRARPRSSPRSGAPPLSRQSSTASGSSSPRPSSGTTSTRARLSWRRKKGGSRGRRSGLEKKKKKGNASSFFLLSFLFLFYFFGTGTELSSNNNDGNNSDGTRRRS